MEHPPSPRSDAADVVCDGVGVAHGIAIAPVYLYARDAFTVEQRELGLGEVEAEVARFEQAVTRSERDLLKIASIARGKLGEESAVIFDAQALMLRDEALYHAVVERIREERANADYAVQAVMQKHRQLLKASDSEYLRERANDLLDVQDRIIRHLRRGKFLSAIECDSIVVAENLTAADIILFSRRNILGCAMDFGGATSHVSIMARALGVPAVVSLHGITNRVRSGDTAVLDGVHGRVVLRPSEDTLAYYRDQQLRFEQSLRTQRTLVPLPSVTTDGHEVSLHANLEFREELPLLETYGAEGIGLFRTEILFLMQGRLTISETEQYHVYRHIVAHTAPSPTTFRVLDLGGDKMLPMAHREQNPFLGWRGIRVLLDKGDVLRPQLRALLRASAVGPTRFLLPMVTNVDEVRRFRAILDEVKNELRAADEDFDEDVPIGIMIEVPAAALLADRLAAEVDFFSIGTNDLTQYTLAVDRGNDLVADRYDEFHPAVLELISRTVAAAQRAGIPVSVCGEMAGNPRATPVLVGLGVDTLSASPAYLPEIKRVLRALDLTGAQDLARRALEACDADGVHALIDAWLAAHAEELIDLVAPHGPRPASRDEHAAPSSPSHAPHS